MKRILAVLVIVFAFSANAFSQIPSFREKGCKGSVTYSNMYLVRYNGVETSHGYMFNENHYLGGGAGAYYTPDGLDSNAIVHFFADYHAYCFDKASTLVVGLKLGYAKPVFPYLSNYHYLEMEPNVGWSWGLNSGNGLTLTLGTYSLTSIVKGYGEISIAIKLLPRMCLSYEF